MCLIAIDAPPPVPDTPARALWLAANRDEFHGRPARALGFWPEDPRLLGGRDLAAGGGWLLAFPAGRNGPAWAALTNVREPLSAPSVSTPSRGALVVEAVRAAGEGRLAAWLDGARPGFGACAGFNLLVSDGALLVAAGNRPDAFWRALDPGRYGLSNAALDTPWPKVLRLRGALAGEGADDPPQTVEARLWAALAVSAPFPDDELPDTGVGLPMERLLSSPFIRGERYGTRCSTLLHVAPDGRGFMVERRFGPDGVFRGETRVAFGTGAGAPV